MSLADLHVAWLARLPKGTRVRATFDLTHEQERESFELVSANECMISIGAEGKRRGFIKRDLVTALDALVTGEAGSFDAWKLDPASLVIDQAPKAATRAQVKALLEPILREVF